MHQFTMFLSIPFRMKKSALIPHFVRVQPHNRGVPVIAIGPACMGHFQPDGGYPALVAAPPGATVDARERRTMAGVLLGAAVLIAAYWVAWLVHRPLVASGSGAAYSQFEDAFPLADGWLALCLVAASYCLVTARRAALFWLLAGGGAGLYLFGMDVLYDLQHGVWGKGANGLVELAINLVTLGLSVFVLHWAWTRREALLTS